MDVRWFSLNASDGVELKAGAIGAGPAALLCMSWHTTVREQFSSPENRPFYDALSSRVRVIACDRRGVGTPARKIGDRSTAAELADLARLMDDAGEERCDVIGDNDGCYLAVRFAVMHPERVRRVALWTPLVTGADARPQQLRDFSALVRDDWDAARRQWAANTVGDASEVDAAEERLAAMYSAETAAHFLEWQAGEDVGELLPQVRAPTLVLASRRHAARSLGVSSLLPAARFEVVDADPGTGMLDVGDVGERLAAFLTER